MRFLQAIFEAPIGDMTLQGDPEKDGSFRASDLKRINNPAWAEKVQKMFAKCPITINIHFVNGKDAQITLAGDEIRDEVTYNTKDFKDLSALGGEIGLWRAEALLRQLPKDYAGGANFILTNNEGDNRVALTPWMVGHRIVHTFFYNARPRPSVQRSFEEMLTILNGKLFGTITLSHWSELGRLIGTTRAAREGIIDKNNPGEWMIDIGVQWMVEGRVRFKRVTDQDREEMMALGWRDFSVRDVNNVIDEYESEITHNYRYLFNRAVGKFFIL